MDSTRRLSTPADNHPLAKASERIIRSQGTVTWLTCPEKLPWTLSSIASLLYLLAFISRVSCDKEETCLVSKLCWKTLVQRTEGLHGGFCVWGSDLATGICADQWKNSHQFSFYIDTVLAVLTFVVGHYVKPRVSNVLVFGMALTIFLHGILHLSISIGVICNHDGIPRHCWQVCPNEAPTPDGTISRMEWAMYIGYNLGLVLMDFCMANFRLPVGIQAFLVALVTVVWVLLGTYFGAAYALPAVFVQSHVMVSLTGVFANSFMITPLVGWCFLAATLVGWTEFLACKPFLLQHYGHVWYDAVLHIAMIASLIPRKKEQQEDPV
jgi:hypothetical protein